jgi:hypothetical protein
MAASSHHIEKNIHDGFFASGVSPIESKTNAKIGTLLFNRVAIARSQLPKFDVRWGYESEIAAARTARHRSRYCYLVHNLLEWYDRY